jgi:hypothetical protein
MGRKHFVVIVAVLGLAGCARFGNRAMMRDVVATLGEGESICTQLEMQKDWRGRRIAQESEPQCEIVWLRGEGDAVMLDIRPEDDSSVRAGLRRIRERGDAVRTHVAPGGQRVWLTYGGKVLASFDREAKTGVIGEEGQPEWAAPE